jgi:K+ transporter
MDQQEEEKDLTIYKQLLDLWAKENPIKTNKLQVLLVVNGLLLSAVNISKGFIPQNWPLYLGGALFSLVWVLSIGRTSLFQEIWQVKINDLATKYPDDQRFQVHRTKEYMGKASRFLRVAGGVSSKYYLVGAPFIFCSIWLCILLYFVFFQH